MGLSGRALRGLHGSGGHGEAPEARTLTCPGSEPTSGQLRIQSAKVTVGEPEHKSAVTAERMHERHEVPGAREANHK